MEDVKSMKKIMLFLLLSLEVNAEAKLVLDQSCTVSVLNRVIQVDSNGRWELPNIPSSLGKIRARATCSKDGVSVVGITNFFTVDVSQRTIVGDFFTSSKNNQNSKADKLVFYTGKDIFIYDEEPFQLKIAKKSDGFFFNNLNEKEKEGINFSSSNDDVVSVSSDGTLVAASSGTVLITVRLDGQVLLKKVTAILSNGTDSDGDGLSDEYELENQLNPNDPVDAFEDHDNDGLSAIDEFGLGTDIRNPDSDGDQLNDGDEVNEYNTLPTLTDTDGDSLSDNVEVLLGSDPTDPNSANYSEAITSLNITPQSPSIFYNTLKSESSLPLKLTANLIDGSALDLTEHAETQFQSSDLSVTSFGLEKGVVFAGRNGIATITASVFGFQTQTNVNVETFSPRVEPNFLTLPRGGQRDVVSDGETAYIVGENGLMVADVSDKNNLRVMSEVLIGSSHEAIHHDNHLFVASENGLIVLDISEKENVTELVRLETDAYKSLWLNGNLLYAGGDQGIHIIDVSNPKAPDEVNIINNLDEINGLSGFGGILAASGNNHLHVFSLSDKLDPVLTSSTEINLINSVSVWEKSVIVSAYSTGYQVYDVSNPSSPRLVGSGTDFYPNDVETSEGFAFFSEVLFPSALPIVNFTDPSNPAFQTALDFNGFGDQDGVGVGIDLSYLYMVTNNRLYIAQYRPIGDPYGISPQVNFIQPERENFIAGQEISVQAIAEDDVAIASVTLSVEDENETIDINPPYEFKTILPINQSALTLKLTAHDLGGNAGSAIKVISLEEDNEPPMIRRVLPRDESSFIAGKHAFVTIDAVDNAAVKEVVFHVNGEEVFRDKQYPYRVSIPPGNLDDSLQIEVDVIDSSENTLNETYHYQYEALLGLIEPREKMISGADGGMVCVYGKDNIECWGNNGVEFDQEFSRGFTELSLGYNHACALYDKQVRCLGSNDYEKLIDQSTFTNPSSLSLGKNHSCLIDNGNVNCWGAYSMRVDIPTVRNPVSIASGDQHACVIHDGGVQCWGNNQHGQTDVPDNVTNPSEIYAGNHHSCVLQEDNIICWGGSNEHRQLEPPRTFANLKSLSISESHMCASDDLGVTCWGNAEGGRLDIPQDVSESSQVLAFNSYSCALQNQELICWGAPSGHMSLPERMDLTFPNIEQIDSKQLTLTLPESSSLIIPRLTSFTHSFLSFSGTGTLETGSLTSIDQSRFKILDGARFTAINDIDYDTSEVCGDDIVHVSGENSFIDLSSVESLTAGKSCSNFKDHVFEANQFGRIDFSQLALINNMATHYSHYFFGSRSGGVTFRTKQEGRIDLSGLERITDAESGIHTRTIFELDKEIVNLGLTEIAEVEFKSTRDRQTWRLDGLTIASSSVFNAPSGHSFLIPNLTSLTRTEIIINEGARVSIPSLTEFTESILTLEGDAEFNTGGLSNIDRSRFLLSNGAVFDQITASEYDSRYFEGNDFIRVEGEGSLLDLSSIHSMQVGGQTGCCNFNWKGLFTVSEGGVVDLSGLTTLSHHSKSSRHGQAIARFESNTGGRFIFSQLREIQGSVDSNFSMYFEEQENPLPALSTINSLKLEFEGALEFSLPNLTNSKFLHLTLQDGETLDAPLLTHFESSVLTLQGSAEFRTLSGLSNIDKSRFILKDGAVFSGVTATSYDVVNVSGRDIVLVEGLGAQLDLSSVENMSVGGYTGCCNFNNSGYFTAKDGGIINLSKLRILNHDSRSSRHGHGLARWEASNNGRFRLDNLTDILGEPSSDFQIYFEDVIDPLPSIQIINNTSLELDSSEFSNLTDITGSKLIVKTNQAISIPNVDVLHGGLISVAAGGELNIPNLQELTNSHVSLSGSALLNSARLTDIDNTTWHLLDGAVFDRIDALGVLIDTPCNENVIQIDGEGAKLDFSSVQEFEFNPNCGRGSQYHNIRVLNGEFDFSGVETLSNLGDTEDILSIEIIEDGEVIINSQIEILSPNDATVESIGFDFSDEF